MFDLSRNVSNTDGGGIGHSLHGTARGLLLTVKPELCFQAQQWPLYGARNIMPVKSFGTETQMGLASAAVCGVVPIAARIVSV